MNLSYSTFIILYLIMFLAGATLGYGIEVLFRRFFTAKKWVNPGFLTGPWLPLYGFGVVIMFTMCVIFVNALPKDIPLYNPVGNYANRVTSGATVYDLIPIACMGVSMILLEFVAGLIFVKGFKVKLWDYSNMRGNTMGIICPLFNVFWFALSIAYYYGLSPFVYSLAEMSATFLFGDGSGAQVAHFGVLFIVGILYGFFIVDLVKSLNLFAAVQKLARESGVTERYEQLKAKQKQLKAAAAAKLLESSPKFIQEELAKKEKQGKVKKEPSKFKKALMKIIFIDPDKAETSGNYDESGRPISTDDESK